MRNIIEVAVELGLDLEEAGDGYRCRCQHPGHSDPAPSLYMHPGEQELYCFGCARGGSVYGLVLWMKPELSRSQVLEMVAGEEGEAGILLNTIHRITKPDEGMGEAPALFAALIGQYAGRPASELPRELIDALYLDDPLPALKKMVAL